MTARASVLITGYGGFVGAAVARRLLAEGYHVRGIARRSYPELAAQGVAASVGDVTDPDHCDRAVRGCDAVIHTAAIAGIGVRRRPFEIANVRSTANIIDAARSRDVSALVYCSSPSVVFDGRPHRNENESLPYPATYLNPYSETKAEGERLALAAASDDFRTCSLRPHLVWGCGDQHLIPRLINRRRANRLRIIGRGDNVIDTVHVETAAAAHVLAVNRLLGGDAAVTGKAFFVTDSQPIRCWDWINMLLHAAGEPAVTRRIPLRAAHAMGRALELLYRAAGSDAEPPMTRFLALQLGIDHYYDVSAARQSLGLVPNVDRVGELSAMQRWMRAL